MKILLKDLAKSLGLVTAACGESLDKTASGVYIGDLLSWVMAKAREDDIWITIQGHINIVAVAMLTGVSCIIVAEGAPVEADTLSKAEEESIPVFTTKLTSFEAARQIVENFYYS